MSDIVQPTEAVAEPNTVRDVPAMALPKSAAPGLLIGVVLLAAAGSLPWVLPRVPGLDGSQMTRTLSLGIVMAIAAMGLNVLTGFTGQISIGHAAFYGVGAYLTGSLMTEQDLTFFATIPIAVIVTALFGALVGLPALRVKGPALALVTLGLAILVPTLLQKFGAEGRSALWKPKRRYLASPIDGLTDAQWKFLVPLAALLIVYVLTYNLVHSRAGRAMIAVRDQEVAASTAGVNVVAVKIASFALSAAYCGLAGSLSVLVRGQADASSALLYFQTSIYFLVAVVIGGAATIAGPIIGAIIVEILLDKAPDWSDGRAGMAPFILGAALILIMYVMPAGIVGTVARLLRRTKSAPPGDGDATDPNQPNPATQPGGIQ